MNKSLEQLIEEISLDAKSISRERKNELKVISDTITQHFKDEKSLEIIVVCTHNSRRSQLGEVWINTLTQYFGMKNISAFSGGMEETAFNYRMVDALKNCGFNIEELEGGTNPKYILNDSGNPNHPMFSKVYDHPMNPQKGFMAIMVCGHADENCPIVFGMKYRIPLRYKDPKEFDDTDREKEAYIEKIKEIGRDIYFILDKVSTMK